VCIFHITHVFYILHPSNYLLFDQSNNVNAREKFGVVAMLKICILEMLNSNFGRGIQYSD
jgi:hypothetical protein